ncbi:hypothetical protein [Aeromonas fluvialis]|uniref:hypothetical protein n=1 Tax=Aeromonas fluvialis TaxID=591962 RepID=UPI0005A65AC5|nr:hypothetical protein [Aeromonas fluvialis]
MRWIVRVTMLLVGGAVLMWGQDKAYGTWSVGFLLAAWLMLEPGLRPALILLPLAGLTGIVTLLWQQHWL